MLPAAYGQSWGYRDLGTNGVKTQVFVNKLPPCFSPPPPLSIFIQIREVAGLLPYVILSLFILTFFSPSKIHVHTNISIPRYLNCVKTKTENDITSIRIYPLDKR